MYEYIQKNEISRRSYVKIFVRSHSSEDLEKDLGPRTHGFILVLID